MSSTTEIFPSRLSNAREIRKMNQGELAKAAGLQPSAISHFETGTRKPSFDNLKKLADALNVSTDYLLGRSEELQGMASGSKIYRHIQHLSNDDIDFAEKLLSELASRNKKE